MSSGLSLLDLKKNECWIKPVGLKKSSGLSLLDFKKFWIRLNFGEGCIHHCAEDVNNYTCYLF